MASVRSETKMVLKVNEGKPTPSISSHQEFARLALNTALPFFSRKVPAESMILPCLELSKDFRTLNAIQGVNKQTHDVFKPLLKSERLQRLQKLLDHVAHGDQEEAEKIIASHPSLLLLRGSAKTYAGDTVKDVNPVELAWGEQDDDMVKMMQLHLNRLPQEYQANLFNQLKERFPETKEANYDFDPLVAAITRGDAKTVDATLDRFRNDFAPRVITREDGRYLNRITKALENAIQIYVTQYDQDNWGYDKLSLFWCKVVGYLQRRLSACYAQAHCQGLSNVTDGGQSLCRDLKLADGSYYFAPPSSTAGLGVSFGIYSCARPVKVWMPCGLWPPACLISIFQNLCRTKTAVFRELMQHLDSHGKKRGPCVIL